MGVKLELHVVWLRHPNEDARTWTNAWSTGPALAGHTRQDARDQGISLGQLGVRPIKLDDDARRSRGFSLPWGELDLERVACTRIFVHGCREDANSGDAERATKRREDDAEQRGAARASGGLIPYTSVNVGCVFVEKRSSKLAQESYATLRTLRVTITRLTENPSCGVHVVLGDLAIDGTTCFAEVT